MIHNKCIVYWPKTRNTFKDELDKIRRDYNLGLERAKEWDDINKFKAEREVSVSWIENYFGSLLACIR